MAMSLWLLSFTYLKKLLQLQVFIFILNGLKLLKATQNMWNYANHCYAIKLKFMKPISLIFPQ